MLTASTNCWVFALSIVSSSSASVVTDVDGLIPSGKVIFSSPTVASSPLDVSALCFALRNFRTSFVNSSHTFSMASPIPGSVRSRGWYHRCRSLWLRCRFHHADVPCIIMFHWCLRSCRGSHRSKDGLPSSFVTESALHASVAAIAAAVAVRIATNSWSCWFGMKRLISSTSILSLLVSWSEGSKFLKSVAQRCSLRSAWTSQRCFVRRFTLLCRGTV